MATHMQFDALRDGQETRVAPEYDEETKKVTWEIAPTKKHRSKILLEFELDDLLEVLKSFKVAPLWPVTQDKLWQPPGDFGPQEPGEPVELTPSDIAQIEGVVPLEDDFAPPEKK